MTGWLRLPVLALAAAAVLPAAEAPRRHAFTLPSGIQVDLLQDHDRPCLELRLDVRWPLGEEPAGREGSASLLARVLQAGQAGPHDAQALARILEERGIESGFQAGPGRFQWTLRCSSALQEEALSLLAHRILRPGLGGTDLEVQRAQVWQERLSMGLGEWADLRFRWELLEGRPEGLATERSLGEVGIEFLAALHRRIVRPERARLTLRGDLNLAQARQLVLLHLGTWGPAPEPALPPAPKAGPRPLHPPACLVLGTGRPEASLALLPPAGPGGPAASLLAELLPRWLQARPADLPGAEGRLQTLEDGTPYVLLRATAPAGGDPADLLLRLRAWAAQVASRAVDAEDLALAGRLRAHREAAQTGTPPGPPASVPAAEAGALLQRWFAPSRQRALLTGVAAIAPDHPALQGLGPMAWVRSKE